MLDLQANGALAQLAVISKQEVLGSLEYFVNLDVNFVQNCQLCTVMGKIDRAL